MVHQQRDLPLAEAGEHPAQGVPGPSGPPTITICITTITITMMIIRMITIMMIIMIITIAITITYYNYHITTMLIACY